MNLKNKSNNLPESFLYLIIIGAVYIAAELITGPNYPVFRDEFYYIDCANHLSWGYVDQPPVSIIILFLWKAVFGTSLISIRILAAVSGAALIILSGFITRSLGGGKAAQIYSAIGVLAVPTYLVTGSFYSMNAFDMLFWAALFYMLIAIINKQNPKLWIWFGVIAGLGLMNKISVAYFGAGVVAAMLFTKERNWFRNKYFWAGGLTAIIIFSPYVIWNFQHDFATLEFIRNAEKYKIAGMPALGFLKEQVIQTNPFNFIICLIGIAALLFSQNLKRYRVIALAYIFIFNILAAQKSKPYYLAAAYPVLISAGMTAVCSFLAQKRVKFVIHVYAIVTVLLIAVFSPILIPILPPGRLVSYMEEIHFKPNTGEKNSASALPQYLADRFGWREMTEKIAGAYNSLSAGDKQKTAILCRNYGEAGAVNYYGRKFGLPEALSGHNSHWFWGYGAKAPDIIVAIGFSKEDAEKSYSDVVEYAVTSAEYVMPFEMNKPVLICRNPKKSFEEIWQSVKLLI